MQSIHNALKVFVPLLTFLLLYSSLNAGTKYARQNGDWDDVNTWSTIGVGGASCSCVPDNVDSVVIDKYKINVLNANDTVTSLLLTNLSGSNAELKISSAYGLVITSNFWAIAEDVDKDVTILIEDDNSYLKVLGNTVFTRTADNNRKKKLRLKMEDDGTMMYVS